MYLMPLNCTQEMVKIVHFVTYVLPQFKKINLVNGYLCHNEFFKQANAICLHFGLFLLKYTYESVITH